jgi:hypothetical protein
MGRTFHIAQVSFKCSRPTDAAPRTGDSKREDKATAIPIVRQLRGILFGRLATFLGDLVKGPAIAIEMGPLTAQPVQPSPIPPFRPPAMP